LTGEGRGEGGGSKAPTSILPRNRGGRKRGCFPEMREERRSTSPKIEEEKGSIP